MQQYPTRIRPATRPPPAVSLRYFFRLSRKGLIAYASSTDCVGPIASSVADCAALLGAVAGEDRAGDSTALQQPVPNYTKLLEEVRVLLVVLLCEDRPEKSIVNCGRGW